MDSHDRSNQEEVKDVPSAPVQTGLRPIEKRDVDALKQQRDLLADFVRSQLVEANFADKQAKDFGEGDFGIVPGTKKRALLKQGAEKLQKLFRLGCRFQLVDKTVDIKGNFAMFTYKCQVFDVASAAVIAECDGVVNSQEKKYKERRYWKKVKKGAKWIEEEFIEPTPVADILNTLQKMAQKRAMVGATVIATGASEYFTQDILEPEDLAPPAGGGEEGSFQDAPGGPLAGPAPTCCGQEMLVSKYPDRELGHKPFYCVKCKKKVPREGAEQ